MNRSVTWKKIIIAGLFLLIAAVVAGCANKEQGNGYDQIAFTRLAEFTDSRGMSKIRLYAYAGEEVEAENIKAYAETLGCGMVYAYFYPADLEQATIPIAEINAAATFSEVQEILFQEEGYGRWHFASQCLGMYPTVADCRNPSLSMQCR